MACGVVYRHSHFLFPIFVAHPGPDFVLNKIMVQGWGRSFVSRTSNAQLFCWVLAMTGTARLLRDHKRLLVRSDDSFVWRVFECAVPIN